MRSTIWTVHGAKMFITMKIIVGVYWCQLLLTAAILLGHINAEKQKRQIYREQLLPALGGKIPEEAFRTDRLALNRLNKDGITVPDGVLLEARHAHKHPHLDQRMPETIKVYLTSDGRYVPPEGRTQYNHPKTVDTTYIIRKPFTYTNQKGTNNFEHIKFLNYPKPQAYSNYRQFIPIKPGVYKPIVAPLKFPADKDLFDLSNWETVYNWEILYEPFDDYFANNIALLNSHQIITDYQGFLNEFHQRSLRHVNSKEGDRNQPYRQTQKYQESILLPILYQKIASNKVVNSHNSAYTTLTSTPETNFSCHGRKEMFADVETKRQVFHNQSDWSKTSSVCPPGTVFCETSKRCEWFYAMQCKQ